jgi:hypothetical protein
MAFVTDTDLASTAAGRGAAMVGFAYDAIGATPRTVDDRLKDHVSVFDFIPVALHGAIRNGINTVDLSSYIAAAIEFEKINKRGLKFPGGLYHSSVEFAFGGESGARYFGDGLVTLYRYTGAGPVVTLDSGGNEIRTEDVIFENFRIMGNAASTFGLDVRNIHRSQISRLRILDVRTAAVRVRHCVSTNFKDIRCSNNVDQFTHVPDTGLLISEVTWAGAPARTTACTFDNIVMEGPFTNICLDLESCDLCTFIGGAFEGALRGAVVRPGSSGNVFVGTDFEVNSIYDVEVFGKRTTFISSAISSAGTAGTALVQSGAEQTTFIGGYTRRINIDGGSIATKLFGLSLSGSPGEGVTGTGPYDPYACTLVNNTLAYVGDLDRGEFVPSIRGGSTPGTQTYSTRAGYFERNGHVVTIAISLTLTGNSGGSGNAQIDLPEGCRNQTGLTIELPLTTNSAIGFGGTNNRALLHISPGASFGTIIQCKDGGAGSALPIGNVGSGTVIISGSYIASR